MITYGNGEVLFDGSSQGFEMRYKGTIRITNSPDNLLLSANKNRIIGVMLDGTDMPQELFNYVGEFRVLSCKSVQGEVMERERITLQGVDYWELDREKWEDDGSLWGTRNGTYLVGRKQRFNKKSIVVNNNIQSNGKFQYADGTPLSINDLIHIMNDGTVMSGGVHTKDSEYIYPYINGTYNMPNSVAPVIPFINTYSLNFDGSDDYVDISSIASTINSLSLGTISLWFKSTNKDTTAVLFSVSDLSDASSDILIYTLTSGYVRVQIREAGSTLLQRTYETDVVDSNWHHLSFVVASGSNAIYIDGVSVTLASGVGSASTQKFFSDVNNIDSVKIGENQDSGGHEYPFTGNIDEVAIWDIALDADAVTDIYNSGTPTALDSDSGNYDNSSNLQGWWRMGDGDTYPTITDNSSNSNDGTMTNMTAGDIEEDTP